MCNLSVAMVSPDLQRRVIKVLTSLKTLSEVSARSYDSEHTSSTAESATIIRFTAGGELAPAEPSLFDLHRGRINASSTHDELELRVLAAEEALRGTQRRSQGPAKGITPEDMREHAQALFEAGLSIVEIAYKEDLPLRWVQNVVNRKPRGEA